MPLDQGQEGSLDLACAACIQYHKVYAENICRQLHLSCFGLGKNRVGRVDKESDQPFCRLEMIRTLSAAHRASLRQIVENSGSSAYAKSSAFSSGVLGHILRIILRLAMVRGNLVLPRMPKIFGPTTTNCGLPLLRAREQ